MRRSIFESKICKTISDISSLLAPGLRLGEGLELILRKICELFGTDTAYIAMPEQEKNELYMHTTFGIDTDASKRMCLSFTKELALLVKTGKGYIIHNCLSDKRVEESLSLY